MSAYYNELEPFAAQWLRTLIVKGLIPDGEVDTRSIVDVQPVDLAGFRQCHFFAGLGGWARALRLAGWDDHRPVWTGSCPCQPFSAAGKQGGTTDARHLWPEWYRLISKCRPATVFGEQVPGAIAHGWLDAVFDDLEGEGYACGAVIAPACSVGAPHRRDRLWFVADACGRELRVEPGRRGGQGRAGETLPGEHGEARPVPDADAGRLEIEREPQHAGEQGASWREPDGLRAGGRRDGEDVADAERIGAHGAGPCGAGRDQPEDGGPYVADADGGGLQLPRSQPAHQHAGPGDQAHVPLTSVEGLSAPECHPFFGEGRGDQGRAVAERGWRSTEPGMGGGDDGLPAGMGRMRPDGGDPSPWSDGTWEEGIPRVAKGIPGRVGRLKAYGNAIVPQVAAQVIASFMEVI